MESFAKLIKNGDWKIARELVESGIFDDQIGAPVEIGGTRWGFTLMHWVVEGSRKAGYGYLDALPEDFTRLVQAIQQRTPGNFRPGLLDHEGRSALALAVEHGQFHLAKLLAYDGMEKLQTRSPDNGCDYGNLLHVLCVGISLRFSDIQGHDGYVSACSSKTVIELAKWLITCGVSRMERSCWGNTLIQEVQSHKSSSGDELKEKLCLLFF